MEAQRGKIIRTKNTPSSGDRRERKKRFDVQGRTLRDASTHAEACKKSPKSPRPGTPGLSGKTQGRLPPDTSTFKPKHKDISSKTQRRLKQNTKVSETKRKGV